MTEKTIKTPKIKQFTILGCKDPFYWIFPHFIENADILIKISYQLGESFYEVFASQISMYIL